MGIWTTNRKSLTMNLTQDLPKEWQQRGLTLCWMKMNSAILNENDDTYFELKEHNDPRYKLNTMSIMKILLILLSFKGIIADNMTCRQKNRHNWCKTLDPKLCLQENGGNYTIQTSCPETCGCWGDTSCCYDSIYCTPGIVYRSGTCCINKDGWCWDGSDEQGNMHGVCCAANETCNNMGSIHGKAYCK